MTLLGYTRSWRLVVLLPTLALLGISAGCRRSATSDNAEATPASGVIRINPSELFINDLKRLEPHLGLTTGCVRLESPDKELFFGIEWELWESGQRVRGLGYAQSRVRKPEMASFSIKETTGPKGEQRYRLVSSVSDRTGSGGQATDNFALEPVNVKETLMSSPEKLDGPRDLAEGEKVLVWAYVIHQDMKHPRGPTINDALAKCHRALAVKVWWNAIGKGE